MVAAQIYPPHRRSVIHNLLKPTRLPSRNIPKSFLASPFEEININPPTRHQSKMVYPRPSSSSSSHTAPSTLYFAYGSNLWLHQMALRCSTAKYIGIARLDGYRWIISTRGYANVVEISTNEEEDSSGDKWHKEYAHEVWGVVYTLGKEDEERLDRNEGVPVAYTKEYLDCEVWRHQPGPVDPRYPHLIHTIVPSTAPSSTTKLLVYIDRLRLEEGKSRDEYVHRMNKGIEDAEMCGVPGGYVRKVVRRWIGEEEGDEGLAERQARGFRDESGVF
jgi:gamma-glutamylcyclotransferase